MKDGGVLRGGGGCWATSSHVSGRSQPAGQRDLVFRLLTNSCSRGGLFLRIRSFYGCNTLGGARFVGAGHRLVALSSAIEAEVLANAALALGRRQLRVRSSPLAAGEVHWT